MAQQFFEDLWSPVGFITSSSTFKDRNIWYSSCSVIFDPANPFQFWMILSSSISICKMVNRFEVHISNFYSLFGNKSVHGLLSLYQEQQRNEITYLGSVAQDNIQL